MAYWSFLSGCAFEFIFHILFVNTSLLYSWCFVFGDLKGSGFFNFAVLLIWKVHREGIISLKIVSSVRENCEKQIEKSNLFTENEKRVETTTNRNSTQVGRSFDDFIHRILWTGNTRTILSTWGSSYIIIWDRRETINTYTKSLFIHEWASGRLPGVCYNRSLGIVYYFCYTVEDSSFSLTATQ